ncbi:MAG: hypothetical protein ACKVTZ_07100 [Bacteroidia bacterium]
MRNHLIHSVVFLLMCLAACSPAPSKHVFSDSSITLKIGEEATYFISLAHPPEQAQSPICWINEPYCHNLEKTEEWVETYWLYRLIDDDASHGKKNFTFRGVKEGIDTLKFKFCRTTSSKRKCKDFIVEQTDGEYNVIVNVVP